MGATGSGSLRLRGQILVIGRFSARLRKIKYSATGKGLGMGTPIILERFYRLL